MKISHKESMQKEMLDTEAKIMHLLNIDSNEYYLLRNNNAYDYICNNTTYFLGSIKKQIPESFDLLVGKFENILLAITNSKLFWAWWRIQYHHTNNSFLANMQAVLARFPEFPAAHMLSIFNETQSKKKVFPSKSIIESTCEHVHASLSLLKKAENILTQSIIEQTAPFEIINSLVKQKGLDDLINELAFAFSNGRTYDLNLLNKRERISLKSHLEKINNTNPKI